MRPILRYISGALASLLFIVSFNMNTYAGKGVGKRASAYDTEDTTLVQRYNKLAHSFYPDEPDSIVFYANRALAISEDIDYFKGICGANRYIGIAHMARYDYEEALRFFQKVSNIAKKNGLDVERAKSFILFALISKEQNDYEEALVYNKRALHIYQNQKVTNDLSSLYNTMGDCYYNMKDYYRALEHFEMAYEQVKRHPDSFALDVILLNIGRSYYNMKNFEKALIYLSEVQNLNEKEEHSQIVLSEVFTIMGAIFLASEDVEGAESYFNKSLIIALQQKDVGLQVDIYERLVELANAKQDYKAVYHNHLAYKRLTDSVSRSKRLQRVAELQIKYKTQLKESKIEQLYQAKQNQRYIIYATFMIAFLMVIILVMLLRQYRTKQKIAESMVERYRIEQDRLKKEIEAKFKEKEAVKSQLEAAKHEHDKFMVILRTTSEEKQEILKELEKNNSQILELEKQLEDRNEEYESEQLFFNLKSQLDMLIQDGAKTSKGELKRIRELIGNLIVEHKNKDFFRSLKEAYSKLSNEDLRLCAFMRNHFSNAEIADFLEITQDTLYTRKHRLKRKLNLEKDVDITGFLLEFDDQIMV